MAFSLARNLEWKWEKKMFFSNCLGSVWWRPECTEPDFPQILTLIESWASLKHLLLVLWPRRTYCALGSTAKETCYYGKKKKNKTTTHHFSLVELRNGCQSKYIYIYKSGLHGVSETSKCTRSLSARQSQKCRFGPHQNILTVWKWGAPVTKAPLRNQLTCENYQEVVFLVAQNSCSLWGNKLIAFCSS